jgi:hypothetical protein
MYRPLAIVLSGFLACIGFTGSAVAAPSVNLLFTEINSVPIAPTNSVTASPGDTLLMTVNLTTDVPLTIAVYSLNYDLDGDNELDLVSAVQWDGVCIFGCGPGLPDDVFFAPVGALDPSTATFVGSFQGITTQLAPAVAAPAGTYQMGTVTWTVNAGVNTDGVDILSGLFNFGVDTFADAAFNDISNQVQFGSATVPEPGKDSLLVAGVLGLLGLAGWRRACA